MSLVRTYPLALAGRGVSLVALAPVSHTEHTATNNPWQARVGQWLVPLELGGRLVRIGFEERVVERLAQTSLDQGTMSSPLSVAPRLNISIAGLSQIISEDSHGNLD